MTFARPSAPDQSSDASSSIRLRILATSDLHANLLPFDYFTDSRAPDVGLARLAGAIAQARAEVPNLVLVDNGDTLQGTPLADAAVAEIVPSGRMHPMIAAMNALRFDAATMGNHDFDFGLPHLEAVLAGAAFPVVCANADHTDGSSFFPRSCLLDREVVDGSGRSHAIKIGITGCLPPQVAAWNRPFVQGRMVFADMLCRVTEATVDLRSRGADVVIVLAHSGMGNLKAAPGSENMALTIAEIEGVDAVIAGHTHRVIPATPPQPVVGTPIVQPGAYGSHLGCIDLTLTPAAPTAPDGAYTIARAECGTMAALLPGPENRRYMRRMIRDYPDLHTGLSRDHRSTRSFVSRPLGETAVQLETYFSALAPCAATQLVADAQFAVAAPVIEQNPDLADLPLLSAVAPFKAGGHAGASSYTDIPVGPLKLRHAADLYIYPNMLCVLRITGRGIRDWLERAASLFNWIAPDATGPQPLIDHDFAPYNFDRLVGLRYQIDVSHPPRTNAEGDEIYATPGRIVDLRFADGRPVRPGDEALVVTNSYRAAGGGHMRAAAEAQEIRTPSISVRDAVARYVSDAREPVAPVVDPTWSFKPLGGVPLVFDTGPGALRCEARLAELGLTAASAYPGPSGRGFQPFHLTL